MRSPPDPDPFAGCGLLVVAGVLVWVVLLYVLILILSQRG